MPDCQTTPTPESQPVGGRRSRAAPGAPARKPRRGRVAIELAQCCLGEILNLSQTGLRVRYRGARANLPRVDERFDMDVPTPDGIAPVRARVAWVKRVGFRKFDVGVHFVAADDRSAALLRQFATTAGRAPIITEASGGSRLRAR